MPAFTPFDNNVSESGESATLIVLFSDDPLLIGEKYPVQFPGCRIGRSSKNDIFFRKDFPVSRQHISLAWQDETLTMQETLRHDVHGVEHRPKFGTFLNELPFPPGAIQPLKDGDVIRLGSRLRLKVQILHEARELMTPEDGMDVTITSDETTEVKP